MNLDENLKERLLTKALRALEKVAGLRATREAYGHDWDLPEIDGKILIDNGGMFQQEYIYEIRPNLTPANLGPIVAGLETLPERAILITRYVNPRIADRLRALDTQFIDIAGNAYLNDPPLFVFITGRKPLEAEYKEPVGRAFNPAGLRILFALLCNPGLEDETLRIIAQTAKVALGTVAGVVEELKRRGYLAIINKNEKRLVHKDTILEKWVLNYPEKLKPQLLIGRYQAQDPFWWKHAELEEFDAYWGGETAAEMLTNYLHAEETTIYATRAINKLLARHRLRRHPKGNIRIYKTFWDFTHQYQNIVPPLLIYADLLATGDPRNIETARMIYDEHLADLIEKT